MGRVLTVLGGVSVAIGIAGVMSALSQARHAGDSSMSTPADILRSAGLQSDAAGNFTLSTGETLCDVTEQDAQTVEAADMALSAWDDAADKMKAVLDYLRDPYKSPEYASSNVAERLAQHAVVSISDVVNAHGNLRSDDDYVSTNGAALDGDDGRFVSVMSVLDGWRSDLKSKRDAVAGDSLDDDVDPVCGKDGLREWLVGSSEGSDNRLASLEFVSGYLSAAMEGVDVDGSSDQADAVISQLTDRDTSQLHIICCQSGTIARATQDAADACSTLLGKLSDLNELTASFDSQGRLATLSTAIRAESSGAAASSDLTDEQAQLAELVTQNVSYVSVLSSDLVSSADSLKNAVRSGSSMVYEASGEMGFVDAIDSAVDDFLNGGAKDWLTLAAKNPSADDVRSELSKGTLADSLVSLGNVLMTIAAVCIDSGQDRNLANAVTGLANMGIGAVECVIPGGQGQGASTLVFGGIDVTNSISSLVDIVDSPDKATAAAVGVSDLTDGYLTKQQIEDYLTTFGESVRSAEQAVATACSNVQMLAESVGASGGQTSADGDSANQ